MMQATNKHIKQAKYSGNVFLTPVEEALELYLTARRLLFRAPFGGPIAIDVDGYTLSLRKDEAALVLIDIQNDV